MKRIIATVLFALPFIAFAVAPEFFIPSWVSPAQSQSYAFGVDVVASGTWQLPPDWGGNIYVYVDGIQRTDSVSSSSILSFYSIKNLSLTASTSGSFSYNVGPQANGAHDIYIKFVGGERCAVNKQSNASFGTTFTPVCDITSENLIYNVYPLRDFTVGLPLYPRMVVTPSTTPALNFSNVTFGSSQTLQFSIYNNGGQTLTGAVTGLTTPFSCSPSCTYTNLNPGQTAYVNITYTPQGINETPNQIINFSCIGTGAVNTGCEGGADSIIVYQPRNIIGNSTATFLAPVLSATPISINYGMVNKLGIPNTSKSVIIDNTGGGILNGTITFSGDPVYTCIPSCNFSILASDPPKTIIISYNPINAGTHNDVATVSSNGGTQSIPIDSTVNDLPILSFHPSYTSINFGANINVGTCRDGYTYMRNTGAGLLSGSTTNMQIVVSPPSGTPPGFSCISANCNYTNLINDGSWGSPVWFRFCPTVAGPASDTAIFTNTVNPPAGASLPLLGNGNNSPIGGFVGSSSFNFGSVLVGGVPPTRSITIQNTGVNGNIVGSVGALPFPEYTCTSGCSYNIAPNTTAIVTLTFTPSAVQTYNGIVILSGIGTASITGAGVKPDFQMSYSGSPFTTCPGTTCVTDIPQTYPRGDYDVGVTTFGGSLLVQNKKFYLYLMNKGSGANINYTLPNTTHFVCLSFCSGILTPIGATGGGVTATFEFQPGNAPGGPGSYTEPLVVAYDYGSGPLSVTLNLTGASVSNPYLSIFPFNIALPPVSVGNTATATYTVTNLGSGFLNGTVTIPIPGNPAPTAGLIHYWTFDDANTNWTTHQTLDLGTPGGNTGYLPGPISAIGQVNEALNFTGRGGMTVPTLSGLAPGNTPHTMAAWIKVNTLDPQRQWIALLGNESTGSNHWLLNSDGSTAFGSWGTAGQAPVLPIGTWVHIATTFDGVTFKSYVNGALSQSNATTFNFPASSPLTLGIRHLNESAFNGLLDDVRIYKRALSATEIGKIYTNTFSLTADLLGFWSFDDPTVVWSQLKVTDVSPKGNDGILSSVPVGVSGKLAQALNFNGQYDDEVTTSFSSSNPQNFSLGAWFKTSSASGRKMIGFENLRTGVSSSYDRQIWMGTDGKIRFGIISGSMQVITSGNVLNDGAWHHVVGTHDSIGNTVLYVDGIAQGSLSAIAQNFAGYWRIGGYRLSAWPYGADGYFVGSIDDMRIYNRPLTVGEVSDLYGAGIAVGLSAFTCVSGCTITNLPSLGAQQVKIEFTPTLAQAYIAYPEFLSDGGNYSYPTIPYPSITGTGVLDPIISVSPTSIIFPDTNQGLSSSVTITISNTGAGNLSGSVSPVKTAGLNFYCLSGCNYNIASGDSATAVIQFSPQSVAILNGTITLNSNAINGVPSGQILIPVSGRGIFAPIISLGAADTDFGSVIVGKYKELTFSIENKGSSSLGSGYFDVTGPFACVNPVSGDGHGHCHYNIGPGDTAVITIRFSPTVLGPASGTVSLSGVPLAQFFVSGTGVSGTVKFIEQ